MFKNQTLFKHDLKEVQTFVKLFDCSETWELICSLRLLSKYRRENYWCCRKVIVIRHCSEHLICCMFVGYRYKTHMHTTEETTSMQREINLVKSRSEQKNSLRFLKLSCSEFMYCPAAFRLGWQILYLSCSWKRSSYDLQNT